MEKIILKNSDLEVSRLCVGGCPLGGHGWGQTDRADLVNTIETAFDVGINFFDTADVYGRGESEKIIAEAIGNKRHKVVIASKFGVVLPEIGTNDSTYYDNSKERIISAIEGSLKRLNSEYVDLYQIHYRDYKTPILEVVETLEKLKKEGKIRYFGLSNLRSSDIEDLKDYKDKFTTFQNEFSLACRTNEDDVKKVADKLEVTPMTWGSLGQGILTGKYTRETNFDKNDRRSRDTYVNFHGEKLEKNMQIVDAMREISNENNKNLSAIAIRWILDYLEDSIVIAGVKSKQQLLSNFEGLNWKLDEKHIKLLNQVSN
jgi:aryl-alcohol dehydrogenase-like predicted oxidoreductase